MGTSMDDPGPLDRQLSGEHPHRPGTIRGGQFDHRLTVGVAHRLELQLSAVRVHDRESSSQSYDVSRLAVPG